MFRSLTDYPPRIAVLGCLFLAGKVEETPKKCKDLLSFVQNKYPTVYAKDTTHDIMNFERILLDTLRFDLQVEHPYNYLVNYAKIFEVDKDVKKQISTFAWTFINDSYSTALCLIWEPEVIAIALLQMSINLMIENKSLSGNPSYTNQPSGKFKNWWSHFVEDLHSDSIEVIEQIMKTSYTDAANDSQKTNSS